ncbi:T9SS type A sorting domain-containing protein [Flavobacterium muglaense]|uniref:T9SS type A sorting domain-containing protein n=1 Tax=Flavobacterium muglaense TaxID=2764716 RepID=A0A923SE70_9FLAO|nr:T9SS type A sorting domain-containing protein [Flavobacterium muglaense]MBC5836828.1 T9SS type A sorting domain-containing protein [Flavobacterium muglaense]MBC5843222.1 T9SS type A sorting domain-containing protein [Flavobacterium muglaense]
MKKITILFILIVSLTQAQTFTVDNRFNPSDLGVYAQDLGKWGVILDNGKILTSKDGTEGIYRLNSDGSADNSFTKTSEPLTTNAKFFFANKLSGNYIVPFNSQSSPDNTSLKSYNSDGSLSSSFTPPIFSYNNGYARINKIHFLSDGKTLVFGSFNSVNGTWSPNMVRLNTNGSVDTTFNIGTGFFGETTAFALQSDGKYVVGGNFSYFNEVSKEKMVRLNPDGVLDTSFIIKTVYSSSGNITGFVNSGPINDIIIQSNGKIVTAGASLYLNGSVSRQSIVRFNSDGTTDYSFQLNYRTNYYPEKMIYDSDGNIYFRVEGIIKKCDNTGKIITTFNDLNINGDVNGDLNLQNNKIIVAGNYKNPSGITRSGYHRLNTLGGIDLTFNPTYGPNVQYEYYPNSELNLDVLPDNKILFYDNTSYGFTTYNDKPVKSIIRLTENGELDNSFTIDPLLNSSMIYKNSLETKKIFDGKLYFRLNSNLKGNYIIRLNSDGSMDKNFNFTSNPLGFKVKEDNKIISFGNSEFYKNGTKYRIVQFNSDSTVDQAFTSPSFNTYPSDLKILDDDKIAVSFAFPNGLGYYNIGKIVILNENGSINNEYTTPFPISKFKILKGGKALLTSNENYLFKYDITDGTIDSNFKPFVLPLGNYIFLSNDRIAYNSGVLNNGSIFNVIDFNGVKTDAFTIPPSGRAYATQNCENILIWGFFNSVYGINKNNICRVSIPGLTTVPAPTAQQNQSFIQGQTLSDLTVNGQNITWNSSQNECISNSNTYKINSLLPSTTLLTNGTTYYASQVISGIESNYRLPITVNLASLGIKEIESNHIKIYPNPVKDKITISNSADIEKIELYNLIGQKIFTNSFLTNKITIDLTNYKSGVYLLKIFSEGKVYANKVIKD